MGPRGAKRAGSVPEWRNLSQGPFSFSEFATAFSHATGWSLRILLLIDRRSPRKVRLQSNPDGNVGGHDSSTSGLGSLIRCPQCLRFDPAVLKRLECSLELLRIRCCNGLTAIFVPMRCENEPVAVLFGGWVFVGEVMPPRFKRFAQPGITGGIMAVSERRLARCLHHALDAHRQRLGGANRSHGGGEPHPRTISCCQGKRVSERASRRTAVEPGDCASHGGEPRTSLPELPETDGNDACGVPLSSAN